MNGVVQFIRSLLPTASALIFLALNGYEFTEDQPKFYDAMIAISAGELDKEGLSNLFREAWIETTLPKK